MTILRHPLRPAVGALAALPIDVGLAARLERSLLAFVARGAGARAAFAREVERRSPTLAPRCDGTDRCANSLLPVLGLFVHSLGDAEGSQTAAERFRRRLARLGFDARDRDVLAEAFVAALSAELGDKLDRGTRDEWRETLDLALGP